MKHWIIGCSIVTTAIAALSLVPSESHYLKAPFDGKQLGSIISMGDVEYGEKTVKLGKTQPNSRAALWFNSPVSYQEWQVTLSFEMKGPNHGSDGIALWYVRQPGQSGPVFGGPERWNGLGVFVDGFDNDSKGNNPAIMGVLNQGDFNYRMDTDGEGQYFGGCVRNVRNTPGPVWMRITYINRLLKIEVDDHKEGEDYLSCLERGNTDLPLGYFFGISAGTGQVADEFYIHSFSLYDLKRKAESEIASKEASNSQSGQFGMDMQNSISLSGMETLMKNMQSNLNVVLGAFKPGDRSILKRLNDLEY